MPKFVVILVLLVTAACVVPASAAPPLSENDRQRLADNTRDHDDQVDRRDVFSDGLYVLLRNASEWEPDDFSGEGGAAVAPAPDYGYLMDNPAEVRGNLYLIEGVFEQATRYPTGERGLSRAGNPAWGDRLTRWAIRTSGDGDDVVLVYFNDPDAKMPAPQRGEQVRVAARFYKIWDTTTEEGNPFSFLTFVGGAYEISDKPAEARFGANRPMQSIIIGLIVMSIAAFFVLRFLMNRRAGEGAGGRTQAYLEQRRRDREESGFDDDDEDAGGLPDDPAEALQVLRQRHDATD